MPHPLNIFTQNITYISMILWRNKLTHYDCQIYCVVSPPLAYSRTYVHPVLSSEASKVLQDFYLHLRKDHRSSDSTPITTRQLESLVRLTEVETITCTMYIVCIMYIKYEEYEYWIASLVCCLMNMYFSLYPLPFSLPLSYLPFSLISLLSLSPSLSLSLSSFQARAKVELREVATEQDAKDIVEIMKNRWNYNYR